MANEFAADSRESMVIYLYRWRLRPEKIGQFEKNWAFITEQLLNNSGSLGSRLHVGSDGIHYAYAQWPNQRTREQAKFDSEEMKEASAQMSDAIDEAFPAVILNPIRDYLEAPAVMAFSDNVPALNQVTIGSQNLEESIYFYKKLNLNLIVKSSNYARFECPNGTTLSLELLKSGELPGHSAIYLEHPRLDEWVLTLKNKGIVFEQEPENRNWLWREAWLKDPFGNRICLFYAGKNRKFPPWRISDSRPDQLGIK